MKTTTDKFLDGKFSLIQPQNGYRAGIDPIFLAASVDAKPGDKVLDAGCGVGCASLALATRCPEVDVVGYDIQEAYVDLFRENVKLNGMGEMDGRVHCGYANIIEKDRDFGTFDHVMTNPPYYTKRPKNHFDNFHPDISIIECGFTLKQWIDSCFKYLKPGGTFTMIHRAERLFEIMSHLEYVDLMKMVHIYPLWKKSRNSPPKLIMVQCNKNNLSYMDSGGFYLHDGTILHNDEGYTEEADDVLRRAKQLRWN